MAKEHQDIVTELTMLLQSYIAHGRSTPGEGCKNDVNVPLRIAPPAAKKK